MVATWASLNMLSSAISFKLFGSRDVDGSPRWRCASGLPTQLVLLPALLCWHHQGSEVAASSFNYIFALYIFSDFIFVSMHPLVKLHHVTCMLGHGLVNLLQPEGFGVFFAGCVVLEIGSGCFNFWLLEPRASWRYRLFLISMTASNLGALYVNYEWLRLPVTPWSAQSANQLLNALITLALIVMRQKTCYDYNMSSVIQYAPSKHA